MPLSPPSLCAPPLPAHGGCADDLELISTDDGVLGSGTQGEVRLGRLRGEHVAVKTYNSDKQFAEPVEHPGLVRVIERRSVNERTVEVRELCANGELFDLVAEEGGMAESENIAKACEWLWQMAATVAHRHSHRVAHGQLRPEHVLLAENEPKILGFTTCVQPSEAANAAAGTGAAGGCGGGADAAAHGQQLLRPKRALDAPELHGCESAPYHARAAADVWALGVLLVFLFSAEPPFQSSLPGAPRRSEKTRAPPQGPWVAGKVFAAPRPTASVAPSHGRRGRQPPPARRRGHGASSRARHAGCLFFSAR